jgi:hypothetical protein
MATRGRCTTFSGAHPAVADRSRRNVVRDSVAVTGENPINTFDDHPANGLTEKAFCNGSRVGFRFDGEGAKLA